MDSDQIVIKNLDHLLMDEEEGALMARDCTPHGYQGEDKTRPNPAGFANSAVNVINPNKESFESLRSNIMNGTVYQNGKAVGWKYDMADQSLYHQLFTAKTLGCEYQTYPDVCLHAVDPLQNFPMNNASVIHYAYVYAKGASFLRSSSYQYYVRGKKVTIDPKEIPVRKECWRQFAAPYDHFLKVIFLMKDHPTMSVKEALLSPRTIPTITFH